MTSRSAGARAGELVAFSVRMMALGAVAVTSLLVSPSAALAAGSAGQQRLWDDSHLLSSADRGELEERLRVAERRLGNPLYLFLVDKPRHQPAPELAERTLRGLVEDVGEGSASSRNPLLLLLSVPDGAAAIATGKGNAGLVTEADAALITRRLMAHHRRRPGGGSGARHPDELKAPLTEAIDAMVSAGEATAARRRPLSAEDDELPPTTDRDQSRGAGERPTGATADVPEQNEAVDRPSASAVQGPSPEAPGDDSPAGNEEGEPPLPPSGAPAGGMRRLPLAIGIAALVVVVLALRRRRNLLAARGKIPAPAPGKPRLPSVIDRPPPHLRPPRDPSSRGR